MTGYELGDIVLVPFPFTDQSAAKKRPAVVVSSAAYNRNRPDIILMAVTSQAHSPHFGDIAVEDWQRKRQAPVPHQKTVHLQAPQPAS